MATLGWLGSVIDVTPVTDGKVPITELIGVLDTSAYPFVLSTAMGDAPEAFNVVCSGEGSVDLKDGPCPQVTFSHARFG
ncbi:hypothetical protein WS68_05820 [Burkholderia sp. TSV86]|nr:hypothetical protein WS68_05820 [Burkholderia sp. TSV86]